MIEIPNLDRDRLDGFIVWNVPCPYLQDNVNNKHFALDLFKFPRAYTTTISGLVVTKYSYFIAFENLIRVYSSEGTYPTFIREYSFDEKIVQLRCNESFVIITTPYQLYVLDKNSLKEIYTHKQDPDEDGTTATNTLNGENIFNGTKFLSTRFEQEESDPINNSYFQHFVRIPIIYEAGYHYLHTHAKSVFKFDFLGIPTRTELQKKTGHKKRSIESIKKYTIEGPINTNGPSPVIKQDEHFFFAKQIAGVLSSNAESSSRIIPPKISPEDPIFNF